MNLVLSRLIFAVLVAAITFALYWPARKFEFVNFDDAEYVYENQTVKDGLTQAGVRWAFTNTDAANWHPLTWLSLMVDVSLFGVNPEAMHTVNAGMHAMAAGMLFLLLCGIVARRSPVPQSDGRLPAADRGHPPPSILVAAFFGALLWALHPLRVESVAWVSSRKDVLSILFCLAGLMAYRMDIGIWWKGKARSTAFREMFDHTPLHTCSWGYWVALTCFGLGYMAKPTMMVFPAFVALLEWLETGRVRWRPVALLGSMAVLFLSVTVHAQTGAITTVVAPVDRLMNAAFSLAVYLRQFLLPTGLSVFYPYNLPISAARTLAGVAGVLGIMVTIAVSWRRLPVMTVGLLWFLAAVVPVLGFIQVGSASHADRYTYLSTLGFSLVAAYGVCGSVRRCGKSAWLRGVLMLALAVVCVAESVVAREYLMVWRNTRDLFEHAAAVTEGNGLAHTALGNLYAKMPGQEELAARQWRAALAATRNAETLANVAFWTLLQEGSGRREEAGALAKEAMSLDRTEKMAVCAMGLYHLQRQDWAQAEQCFAQAIEHFADNPLIWEWLAMSCVNQKKYEEALVAVTRAVQLNPASPRYRLMLEQLKARHTAGTGPRLSSEK